MTPFRLFGSLSPAEFLSAYWQKRPLLVRDAVPDLGEPIDPDSLAGLACEPDVESRLVVADRRASRWTVEDGPLPPERFAELPERNWTLLVQAVDHWVPAVSDLIGRFRFLPNWRLDDVMVSYAVDGGGVGPHFDSYDVFLLQGRGQRRWLVGDPCDGTTPLLSHDRLRLLRDMAVREDHLLDPGDMLYLPPGIAHDGIAVGDCMTYSIGFRAPGVSEALAGMAELAAERLGDSERYRDPDLSLQDNPGEIAPAALERLRGFMLTVLNDADLLAEWLGRWSTEPKVPEVVQAPDMRIDAASLSALFDSGVALHRNDGSRIAFVDQGDGSVMLFVDGEPQVCAGRAADLARLMAAETRLPAERLSGFMADPVGARLLVSLVNAGALFTE